MKTTKILILAILIQLVVVYSSNKTNAFNYIVTTTVNDTLLKLKIIKSGSDISLQVSFNGEEGNTGKLKIYNSQNQLVNTFDVQLKKAPDYFKIILNEFANDTYKVDLITLQGIHTSQIIIN